eukprot:CAMPEP_0201593610 /NCGR_PEP_ID=MMETSP0190_2-20130828/191166_1 /ASSEMBLY_ACC=CAM_ASM_000263 /TAXON_ID=37353 /ORGANISM="Rosalina sp." /LENGTH=384 /DNA_ID=CAMNT_0048052875 /DNA_START=116 /DNA_END=1268 /DNA_ORIENTATION=-
MTKLNNDMKVEKINHNDVGQLKREGLSALINNGEIDVHCDKTGPRKARFSLWVGERDMHNLCHHHQITNTPQYSYSNPLFSSHYGQYQQPPYQYDPNRQSPMSSQQPQHMFQQYAPPIPQRHIFQHPQSYTPPEYQQYAPSNRENPTNHHAHMSPDAEQRRTEEVEAKPVEDERQRDIDYLRKIELLRSELANIFILKSSIFIALRSISTTTIPIRSEPTKFYVSTATTIYHQKSAPPNSQTHIFQHPQSYMSPEHQQYAPPNRANPTNQHTQAHMSADEHRLKGELEARPVEDERQREIDHLRKEIELLRSELGTAREQLVQCHLEHRTLHSQREEEEEKKDIARATAASMEQMQRTVDDLASRKQHAVQMAASMDHGMVETD